MSNWKNYVLAKSLDDALTMMRDSQRSTQIIAGGTDLLLEMQQGSHPSVDVLVDIHQVPELCALGFVDDELFIGAAVPVSKITTSPSVIEHAKALAEATGLIGGPQVRNTATLGGNVAHALPAADGMIALVALDATAIIYGKNGYEHRHMLSLFNGPGVTAIARDEILVGFNIPKKLKDEASAFSRVMRPQGVALPIINLAVWVKRAHEKIQDVRIAFGPSGPTPSRALAVEETLKGLIYDESTIEKAISTLHETVKFRTSKMRATAEYRHELAEVLIKRVMNVAWARTKEDTHE